MSAMEHTEHLTQQYRHHYDLLIERVNDLEQEIQKLKRRRLPGIKSALHAAAQARDELNSHIKANPELWVKPRTVVIAGIRVGMTKGKGKIEIADEERVVARIRQHMADRFDDLVKTTEKPIKKALQNLSVAELKRLGCKVDEAGDQVVIKPVDDDISKLVDALLAEAEELEAAA